LDADAADVAGLKDEEATDPEVMDATEDVVETVDSAG
jgi:hypothetical protein